MTYAESGVNYNMLDPFKRLCQRAAMHLTDVHQSLGGSNFQEIAWTRGESAYAIRLPGGRILLHVEEGLGTKNLVADAMYKLTGRSYYDHIAQDTVAMIANDMATLGVEPVTIAMHLAVASGDWFEDLNRSQDLVEGWKQACETCNAFWSGGETPSLKGVIVPGTALLSGSATGYAVREENLINPIRVKPGDAIVIVESSGIHANGLTLAREIASKLPQGYMTVLPSGRTYGDVLLDPTHLYSPLIGDIVRSFDFPSYAVNITGHGWRKLMRATQPLAYVIDTLPSELEIFKFIQEHGPVAEREMYANYNMGAGFAIYCHPDDVKPIIELATKRGLTAFRAGTIFESDKKRVVIEPKGIIFEADELAVR